MLIHKKPARVAGFLVLLHPATQLCHNNYELIIRMIFNKQKNIITAYGTISEGDGAEFTRLISDTEQKHKNIIIKLHTYGGSVFDGNLMCNALQSCKSNVELHIVGIAASMGAILSLYSRRVLIAENGFLMLHAPSGYTNGTASEHHSSMQLLKSIEENFIKKLIEKTSKTEREVRKWLIGDNWFNAQQALRAGLVTEIISSEVKTKKINPKNMNLCDVYNRFSALLDDKIVIENKINMKQTLIEAFSLQDIDEKSSETAVIESVKNKFLEKENSLKEELKQVKEKLQGLEASIAKEQEEAIKIILNKAKNSGKINLEQEKIFKNIAETNGIKALKVVLDSIPIYKSISSQIHFSSNSDASRDNWNFDDWQKKDPKGLEAKAKEEPEWFKHLYENKFKTIK